MSNHDILTTERLVFREFHLDDAAFFLRLNSDWEVMKYTGDVAFKDIEEARDLVRNYDHYRQYGYGRWTVFLRESMERIGWCGLKNHPDEGYIDLGYRFERQHWGRGYATEAAEASIAYGFDTLNMNWIVGRTASENKGSIRVLEKVGMTFWKKAPCEGIVDSLFYEIRK
ncbi:MAG: GNAT family N-acetyltransferase [Bacteroidia bacterium]|nr:GNAT family N-acetyltransferase [Bacteroidia bacterium]